MAPEWRPNTENREQHLVQSDSLLDFEVAREHVFTEHLFVDGADTGLALCYDHGFCTCFTVTVIGGLMTSMTDELCTLVIRRMRHWLGKMHVVSLSNTDALPGLAQNVRARVSCSPVQDTEFILFKTGRIRRGQDFECAVTIGWDYDRADITHDRSIVGDDHFANHTQGVTVSRRRAALELSPDGKATVSFDRPLAFVGARHWCDMPFKMRAGRDSPDIPSNRLNKIMSSPDGVHRSFDVHTIRFGLIQVTALWGLCTKGTTQHRDVYNIMGFFWALARQGSLRLDRHAAVIQRWWRRASRDREPPAASMAR